MNDPPEPPPPPPNERNAVNLGTSLRVHLCQLFRGQEPYTSQDLIRAMRDNTTLTRLDIDFRAYRPTQQQDDQGFVQFLLQYITGRIHLRELVFWRATPRSEGMSDFFRQFIMAAAQNESIQLLRLDMVEALPVEALAAFCRANRNAKTLHLSHISLTANRDDPPEDLQGDALELSSMSALEKLVLTYVAFGDSRAAFLFADLFSWVKTTHLELGNLKCCFDGGENLTPLFSSQIKNSAVKHLTLREGCAHEHVTTVLMEGKPVVEALSMVLSNATSFQERDDALVGAIPQMVVLRVVRISFSSRAPNFPATMNRLLEAVDANASITEVELKGDLLLVEARGIIAESFNSIVTAILDCAKLRALHLTIRCSIQLQQEAKKRFFQALDASTSLTNIEVNDGGNNFSPDEMQLLRAGGRAERNIDLRRFVANPSGYPGRDLLALFLKVEHSLSGQFTLVRNLPVNCFRGRKKSDVREGTTKD